MIGNDSLRFGDIHYLTHFLPFFYYPFQGFAAGTAIISPVRDYLIWGEGIKLQSSPFVARLSTGFLPELSRRLRFLPGL